MSPKLKKILLSCLTGIIAVAAFVKMGIAFYLGAAGAQEGLEIRRVYTGQEKDLGRRIKYKYMNSDDRIEVFAEPLLTTKDFIATDVQPMVAEGQMSAPLKALMGTPTAQAKLKLSYYRDSPVVLTYNGYATGEQVMLRDLIMDEKVLLGASPEDAQINKVKAIVDKHLAE